eukprot:gene16330-17968_t
MKVFNDCATNLLRGVSNGVVAKAAVRTSFNRHCPEEKEEEDIPLLLLFVQALLLACDDDNGCDEEEEELMFIEAAP